MRSPRKSIILACLGAATGCAAPEDASTPTAARSATPDALRSPEPPRRGTVLGGERVRRVAQWPVDDAIDESVVAMMPPTERGAIDELTLPALVSSRPEFASSTKVMPGPRWYATWSQHDGLTVTLNASGEARVHPHVSSFEGNERVRGTDAFVTQNETIWSVTWVENGIAYDLGLECKSPTMPQCQSGAYAMDLAEDLVFVGPREGTR